MIIVEKPFTVHKLCDHEKKKSSFFSSRSVAIRSLTEPMGVRFHATQIAPAFSRPSVARVPTTPFIARDPHAENFTD